MIYLNEVCEKISEILNSDENPTGLLFAVESVGFHADKIYDKETNQNFIMVYVSSFGGEFNPVPNLGQAIYSIPITFYFPVRMKESFFVLDAYLHSVFVGASLTYGANTGKAVSNLSVANYGEIQNLDLQEFEKWASTTYRMPIEIMEEYMSMNLTLSLSTIADGYVFANEVSAELKFPVRRYPVSFLTGETGYAYDYPGKDKTVNGVHWYYFLSSKGFLHTKGSGDDLYDDLGQKVGERTGIFVNDTAKYPLVFSQGSAQSQSQSSDNQYIGELESDGLPYSTTFGYSFAAYVKSDLNGTYLFNKWLDSSIGTMNLTIEVSVPSLHASIEKPAFVSSGNLPIIKGQPLALTFSFAKRTEV